MNYNLNYNYLSITNSGFFVFDVATDWHFLYFTTIYVILIKIISNILDLYTIGQADKDNLFRSEKLR